MCIFCQKEYTPKRVYSLNKFCSIRCGNNYHRQQAKNLIMKKCQSCKRMFAASKRLGALQKYCHITCHKCESCNKEYERHSDKQRFCSHRCAHLDLTNKTCLCGCGKKVLKQIAAYYKGHHPNVIRGRANNKKLANTTIEIKIQQYLTDLKIDFVTQHYIPEIKHKFSCDIFIPSMNKVIECDGDYWHKYPIGNKVDHIRNKELTNQGFSILRLWEREIRTLSLNEFKERLES